MVRSPGSLGTDRVRRSRLVKRRSDRKLDHRYRSDRTCYHDGAHRRYFRHFLHHQAELHRRSGLCTARSLATALPPPLLPSSAGPANTTYGENTGVLALSKVYDPRVIRIAAVFAIILSFSPKFAAVVELIPTAVHRRRFLHPLRYDLRYRYPQPHRKPDRLFQEPQPHHHGCHLGLRAQRRSHSDQCNRKDHLPCRCFDYPASFSTSSSRAAIMLKRPKKAATRFRKETPTTFKRLL